MLGQPARHVTYVIVQSLVSMNKHQPGIFARRRGASKIAENGASLAGVFDIVPENRGITRVNLGNRARCHKPGDQCVSRGEAAGENYGSPHKLPAVYFAVAVISD